MTALSACSVSDELLFGVSDAMERVRRQINNIAESGLPLVVEGESGTGKELLARCIHARSPRAMRPFVKINCSAGAPLPPMENILFARAGAIIASQTGSGEGIAGTILFDDVGELDGANQTAILGLLQDPRVSEIGVAGVQVIFATKTPLRAKLERGEFRDDLYYRISVVHLVLPRLRDRRADIPSLASYFINLYAQAYQKHPVPLNDRLLELLLAADWPGNIRELENAIKRYVILDSQDAVVADLQQQGAPEFPSSSTEVSLKALKRNVSRNCEYSAILTSLNRNQWNRRKTAQELDISYRSLLYAMEQLGFPRKRSRPNTTTASDSSGEEQAESSKAGA